MLLSVGVITLFMGTEPQGGSVHCSVAGSCAGFREAVVCPLLAHWINQVLAEKILVFLLVGSRGAITECGSLLLPSQSLLLSRCL